MDKRLVKLGGLTLGAGQPAICVPVMGGDAAAIGMAAAAALAAKADIIELRADSVCPMPDLDTAKAMCKAVRANAPGIPILFTLRTRRDGGPGEDDALAYEALLCGIAGCKERLFDAIDVELSVGEETFARIVRAAHAAGIAVVGSSHDFTGTPQEAEICGRLSAMQRLDADVCKIAVMPKDRLDVLTLMRAAVVSDEALTAPVIAIAMGPMGALTRVGGEAIGSCLTFGTAGQASAPGQIDARQLRSMLEVIHNSL